MNRHALLSMDIEDWIHVDYLNRHSCDTSYTMLDGIDRYIELIDGLGVPSSFFCLGELAEILKDRLREIYQRGWEIGSHTYSHCRPLLLSLQEVEEELRRSKITLEQTIGGQVEGFRAPCFSFDRNRLELLPRLGYTYDTSLILFELNSRYGNVSMDGFRQISKNIFELGGFFEFQMSTQRFLNQDYPVSGGGYLRMFPWLLTKTLLNKFLENNELYTLYIHPYELSNKPLPPFPLGTSPLKKIRFGLGRKSVAKKIIKLVSILKDAGYQFTTFKILRHKLLHEYNVTSL
jgi:peptidoglycan/xylan/chitin deacetylase (PgdA/CDA1 family)